MPEAPLDQRFEDGLRRVVELHSSARRLRSIGDAADASLSTAQRVGEAVRRAIREGSTSRPDASDCLALEESSDRLSVELERALRAPAADALRRAAAASRGAEAATVALDLLNGLSRCPAESLAGYVPIQARRRARGGESLIHPRALADEITAILAAGLRPAATGAGDVRGATALPDPILLAPSFETCDAEVALRRPLRDLDGAVLRDQASGDLWIFVAVLPGPFAVTIAAQADDEWWAASSLRYSVYRDELRDALEHSGVAVEIAAAG